jgi:hypothetical protein
MGENSKREYAGGREWREGCAYEIRRTKKGRTRENAGDRRVGKERHSAELILDEEKRKVKPGKSKNGAESLAL